MRHAAMLLTLVLGACASSGAAPSPSQTPSFDGAWQLTVGRSDAGEVPVVEDHPITLTITGMEISGTAACNQYGARLVPQASGGVTVSELGMTAMGCAEPLLAAESAYTAALVGVNALNLEGDELVLSGPGVELRFAPLPSPPTAELVDVVWVLETVFVGDVASPPRGEEARLELRSDGTFSGSTGCRSFTGQWIEAGEQIRAPTMGMDGRVCPPDLADQDGHVVSVVGDGFVPTIEGDLLTLTDPGGVGLVYRATE